MSLLPTQAVAVQDTILLDSIAIYSVKYDEGMQISDTLKAGIDRRKYNSKNQLIETTVIYDPDVISELSTRKTYSYEMEDPDTITNFIYISQSEWSPLNRSVYTRSPGMIVRNQQNWDPDNTTWKPSSRSTTISDTNGILDIIEENYVFGTFDTSSIRHIEYDDLGRRTLDFFSTGSSSITSTYIFDDTSSLYHTETRVIDNNDSQAITRYTYSYNEHGRVTRSVTLELDAETQIWDTLKYQNSRYDDHSNRIELVEFEYIDSQWIETKINKWKYNEADRPIEWIQLIYDSDIDSLTTRFMSMSTYDERQRLSSYTYRFYNPFFPRWYQIEWTRNDHDLVTWRQRRDIEEDGTLAKEYTYRIYHYSSDQLLLAPSLKPEIVHVYPNPASDYVQLIAPTNFDSYSWYNLAGQKLGSASLQGTGKIPMPVAFAGDLLILTLANAQGQITHAAKVSKQ